MNDVSSFHQEIGLILENLIEACHRISHLDSMWHKIHSTISSHRSKELKIQNNVSLIQLPPCSPELNPADQV